MLVAVALLVTIVLPLPPAREADARLMTDMLQMASLVLALGVSAMGLARWRLTGDAAALWIAAALLVFGIVRLGVVELLPVVVAGDVVLVLAGWLRPASLLVTAGLLTAAAMAPLVDSGLKPLRVCGIAAVAIALVAAIMGFMPGISSFVDGVGGQGARPYVSTSGIGVMPLLWLTGAGAFIWIGRRRKRWLFTGCGLLLLALTLGEVTRAAAPGSVVGGLLGRELIRLIGLTIALSGATREVLHTYEDASRSLFRFEYRAATTEQRMRVDAAAAEERAHEARSALAAIEGATVTLERYRDRLDVETRGALASAVSTEIRRLQRLVSTQADDPAIAEFRLAAVLEPLLGTERARGTEVVADIPAALTVLGRADWTQQIVQTLLDNARRYAPGSAVTVRADADGDRVVVRVEDRGPGVDAQQRTSIFRRGVRGDAAENVPGSGLGLYIAEQLLLRTQVGQLWVDEREGGGASFALALPCGSGQSLAEPRLHVHNDHELA
ncbi:MAG: HAMP domain-containing histidine kinase [Actinomycetota bacterium]|nr:HAMP domain-containing histidine kinase [Actinomycetota bacterium]